MVVSRPAEPVGRSVEYRRLVGPLRSDSFCLLVISGPPGSGRSHLIEYVRDAATDLGYRSSLGVNEDLVVNATTTLSDVLRALTSVASDRRKELTLALWFALGAALVHKVLDTARLEREVLNAFTAAAPLLLAVEGYAPNAFFELWVRHRLIRDLRARRVPIILVVAGSGASVSSLARVADAAVELADLDVAEVKNYLKAWSACVNPPLSDQELDCYSEAASRQPSLVNAFSHVLDALAREGSVGTS
jgi:hypothetical protein